MLDHEDLLDLLDRGRTGNVLVLTGAGVSAESGIPTFRGPEGYWTVGSENYQPSEIGTRAAFERMPREVWRWYLFRRTVCAAAEPNAAHHAIVELDQAFGERFRLITQNVDGLHERAGTREEHMLRIHGDLTRMRSATGIPPGRFPLPENLPDFTRDTPLDDEVWERLVVPGGQRARPHVLWFDETYDEENYYAQTALQVAAAADLLIVVGTSGATTLPIRIAAIVAHNQCAMIDINPHENPFSEFATDYDHGAWVPASAAQALPPIVTYLIEGL